MDEVRSQIVGDPSAFAEQQQLVAMQEADGRRDVIAGLPAERRDVDTFEVGEEGSCVGVSTDLR